MEWKQLGVSSASVPAIGLGTWRYQGGAEPLRAGLDCGACFIDTAEGYGSEEIVGTVIRGRRQQVFVASKVSPRNFRRQDLLRAVDSSLRRLGTDYIDLYQLHWPNLKVPMAETMGTMEELADCGKIRFIGVSNFSIRELRKAQTALSRHPVVSNQVRYSLIDRTIETGLLDYCRQHAITIIAFSPLGLNFSNLRAADPEAVLARVARQCGKTEAQVALNWLIAKEGVVAIPKAFTAPHAVENCGSAGWRLPDDARRLLETKIRFRRRGSLGAALRYGYRYVAQTFGRSLG